MSHQHYEGCHLHHFVCAQERIRELEKELARRSTPTFAGYRPPVFLGNPDTGTPPPAYTTSATVIPCGDPFFTHHGDEPPSATV